MKQVWHYTTGQNFKQIVMSGVLLPTAKGVKPPERPILWFSADQYWEPTANKGMLGPGGKIRSLTMLETRQYGGGLVRFGYDAAKCLRGEDLCTAARMKPKIWKGLIKVGLEQLADPVNWYGTTDAVVLGDINAIEVMDDSLQWVKVR